MILTDSEKILVALGALVIILAIVANAIKDYKRMTREANKKVEQKLKDEEYIRELKKIIDKKNKELEEIVKSKKNCCENLILNGGSFNHHVNKRHNRVNIINIYLLPFEQQQDKNTLENCFCVYFNTIYCCDFYTKNILDPISF